MSSTWSNKKTGLRRVHFLALDMQPAGNNHGIRESAKQGIDSKEKFVTTGCQGLYARQSRSTCSNQVQHERTRKEANDPLKLPSSYFVTLLIREKGGVYDRMRRRILQHNTLHNKKMNIPREISIFEKLGPLYVGDHPHRWNPRWGCVSHYNATLSYQAGAGASHDRVLHLLPCFLGREAKGGNLTGQANHSAVLALQQWVLFTNNTINDDIWPSLVTDPCGLPKKQKQGEAEIDDVAMKKTKKVRSATSSMRGRWRWKFIFL